MNQHGRHIRGLLVEIEADHAVSQRRLAHRLGIALGLTNLLIRRVVAKGWVKVVHVQPNRVSYLVTPAGIAAKARLTREYIQGTLQFYAEARERVRERFAELSAGLDQQANGNGSPPSKRIVFYGAGEIAEVGYVSLQETDLQLVGVIDASRAKPFFGLPVHRLEDLRPDALNGEAFDRLVVMSVSDRKSIVANLEKVGFPRDRAFWI